ncbi:glycosyltransferase [Gymnodinialimonas sp. 2305UL16-5]|uniref:glycosyltransferase family 2 protein n=1 Tax=Gymnodinialimonas mytili TaxID=3126503 RepID=UPI003098C309
MHKDGASVCVIIAAYNSAATIGAAVTSALMQAEVAEVVVVDDASADGTAAAAAQAASGDARLSILRLSENHGPAAARNMAIAQSTAPFIAILDADDCYLDGRFRHMLQEEDWDLIADNIVFVPEDDHGSLRLPKAVGAAVATSSLNLADFVAGNLSRSGAQRGELGFLKPVMRREFLTAHGLRYDPDLRLGEDYDLYVRALLHGARFRVSRNVGYAARVRSNSLSSSHRTTDLHALLQAAERHIGLVAASDPAKPAMVHHRRQLRARYLLRAFLDRKAEAGLLGAARFALMPPTNMPPIVKGVMSDKLAAMRPRRDQSPSPVKRYLMPPVQIEPQTEP